MKRIVTIAMTVVAAWLMMPSVMANPITVDSARQNVLSFLQATGMKRSPGKRSLQLAFSITQPHPATRQAQPVMYAFSIEGEGSVIIASGDDVARPVLGYYAHGGTCFDSLPPNTQAWLRGYAREIAWAQSTGYRGSRVRRAADSRPDIPFMVKTTWDQGYPYYNQCKFNNIYCYTGCVATAMAQIMHYWAVVGHQGQTFAHGSKSIPAYKTETRKYSVSALDSLSSFSWADMTLKMPVSASAKAAIAQLMRYCGQSVHMDYTRTSSGAYSEEIANAFSEYFGYDEGAQLMLRDDMSAEEWDSMVYAELAAGRPVCMGGADEQEDTGHEFICDGYQSSDDTYHFNWGWSGYCDGYFALEALAPGGTGSGGASSTSNYNYERDVVIGIKPPRGNGGIEPVEPDDPTREVTFLSTEDLGTQRSASNLSDTVSKSGVTLTVTPTGSFGNGHQYRIYKGSDLTVTSTAGDMVRVVFTCIAEDTQKYGPGCLSSPSSGEYSFEGSLGVWKGRAATFSLVATQSQVRITDITVYLADGQDPTPPPTPIDSFLPGDINHDGMVSVTDISMLVNYVVGKSVSGFDEENADINKDGKINISDVMMVSSIVSGLSFQR